MSRSMSHAPAPTPGVQLDKWAAVQAPLSDAERASVSRLADWIAGGPSAASGPSVQRRRSSVAAASALRSNGVDANAASSSRLPEQAEPEETPAAAPSRAVKASAQPSLPTAPIHDAPAFLAWFASQQAYISSSTESAHTQALAGITAACDEADALLQEIEAARVHIAELRAGARYVEEGSEGLREEAESMVEKMDHLSTLSEALSLRLSYFSILPTSTSFLNSPSVTLVLSPDFLHTLDRLDVGLEFVQAHPQYKDAALYRMRFEHCVVRAGQLIRLYLVQRMQQLVQETGDGLKKWEKERYGKGAAEKSQGSADSKLQDLADPDLHGLMYDKFSTESMQMRPLLAELEKRAAPSAPAAASMQLSIEESDKVPPMNEDALLADYSMTQESDDGRTGRTKAFVFSSPEFAAMLSECRAAYFDARRALLLGLIGSCLARIEAAVHAEDSSASSSSADSFVVRLARRGLDFLRALCESEYKLCDHFFVVDDDEQRGATGQSSAAELQAYLETICAALHDRVRPRIQKETSPAVLSRICAALLEVPAAEEPDDAPSRSAELLLQPLLRPLLDAAQAQLVLKAREDFGKIAAHTPTADDVDYPAKLGGAAGAAAAAHRRAKSSIGGAGLFQAAEAASAMAASAQRAENEGKIRLFTAPPASVTRTWYTPLTRTLQGLSLVYERVPTSVFYDVGMSAVEACRASLVTGAEALRTGGGGLGTGRIGLSGRLDGPLFWLRHLLLLREIALSVQLSADTGGHGPADRIAALTGHARGAPAASAGMALDFATVASVVNALWAGTSALLAPRSLYQLARGAGAAVAAPESPMPPSSPRETSHAAMQQLEEDIQRASTQLVAIIAESTALPLRVYISQISRTPLPAATEPRSPDAQSPEAGVTSPTSPLAKRRASEVGAVGKARGAYDAFCKCTEVNLKEARSAIRAYLEDERAMGSLVEPVLSQVIESYEAFTAVVRERHPAVAESELPGADEIRGRLTAMLTG
ncbi:hypothetical protein FA09DRAFT_336170 [Tilletiopsis washingtonensis]|uniref:Conserved oligomeric Golgi complex subunit 3 n=1 Tax=Tilletiopsis washingtonensis TaxID=58919 RepID=A0A316ZIC4_9BASI|nr:hypothetical protein FA09DRAFT_336170 [Tilletiopsis washingtonensis]PWO00765.1 hypothetical protein FA09DRAFT_336170 [Tilletiopsis washingtonensis]